jgi:MFS family permease
MSAVLQNSWAIGYLISALLYATIYDYIGWRGMLWLGVLPALAVVWIRFYVKEPEIWVENQRLQKVQSAVMKAPLFAIFRRKMIWNTITACMWMASGFVTYYATFGLFATYLQKDLKMSAAAVGWPLVFANIATFVSAFLWGVLADRNSIRRRTGLDDGPRRSCRCLARDQPFDDAAPAVLSAIGMGCNAIGLIAQTKEQSMQGQAGVWIDHKEAFVVLVGEGGEKTERIASGMEKHVRFSGRSASEEGSADDQRDRQFGVHLDRYYDDVIAHVRDAKSILLFGPGEAKGELEKHLVKKGLGGGIVGIETTDKMTDRQIAAKVRKYFRE